VLAFTLSNTISTPWSALLPSTFSKLHVPSVIVPFCRYRRLRLLHIRHPVVRFQEISAKCGLFMILHTFAMSLTISKFADYTPGYSKELALFSRFVSLVFLFWLMLMMNFRAKLTTSKSPLLLSMPNGRRSYVYNIYVCVPTVSYSHSGVRGPRRVPVRLV